MVVGVVRFLIVVGGVVFGVVFGVDCFLIVVGGVVFGGVGLLRTGPT